MEICLGGSSITTMPKFTSFSYNDRMPHPNQGHMSASVCPSSRGRNTPWTGHHSILIHSHPGAVWSLCAHLHDNKNTRFHCSYAFYTRTVPRHYPQAFKKGLRVKTLLFSVKMMAAMVDYQATRAANCVRFVVAPPTKCGLAASLRWHAEAQFFIHHRPNPTDITVLVSGRKLRWHVLYKLTQARDGTWFKDLSWIKEIWSFGD